MVNVLDITATVDIILDPDSTRSRGASSGSVDYYPSSAIGSAFFSWEGNDLYVESEYNIGGIQLSFDTDFEYQLSGDLTSVESLDFITDRAGEKIVSKYSDLIFFWNINILFIFYFINLPNIRKPKFLNINV